MSIVASLTVALDAYRVAILHDVDRRRRSPYGTRSLVVRFQFLDDPLQCRVGSVVELAVDVVVIDLDAELVGASVQGCVHRSAARSNISEIAASGQLVHVGRLASS